MHQAVLECADYAFSLLNESIHDDAMYCLFDWDAQQLTLTIAVTDETKTRDGKHKVKMSFNDLKPSDALADEVKYWIKDHLTTSLEFLRFSLVAGFTRGDRARVELL